MKEKRPYTLHVRVTYEMQQRLEALAQSERRPLASLLAILLDEALERREAVEQ